jgi:hypothetical protein
MLNVVAPSGQLGAITFNIVTLSIMALNVTLFVILSATFSIVMPSAIIVRVVMQSVIMTLSGITQNIDMMCVIYVECHFTGCHYA